MGYSGILDAAALYSHTVTTGAGDTNWRSHYGDPALYRKVAALRD